MKKTILILSIILSILASFPGPGVAAPTVTSLGSFQMSSTLQTTAYAREGAAAGSPTGDMYSVWAWYLPSSSTTPSNIFSLNHDTGVVTTTVHGPPGRPYSLLQHPDSNLIYIGTGVGVDSPMEMGTFNFVTGVYTKHADSPNQAAYNGGVTKYDSTGNNGMTWSDEPHKRVFYYGALYGTLWALDPTDWLVQNYGPLDSTTLPSSQVYGNSFQVDATYAYCERKTTESYLVIKQLASPYAETTKWKGDGCTDITLYRGWSGSDAEKIFVRKTLGGVVTWYNVSDLNTPISAPSTYPSPGQRYYVNYTGYAYDTSLALPDGVGGKAIPLYYKKTGDTNYRIATATLLDIANCALTGGGMDLNGNLFGFAQIMARYNVTTGQKVGVGNVSVIPGNSNYCLGVDYYRRLMFFGGYSQQSWQYDPALPWVLGTNPKRIVLARAYDAPVNAVADARYYYSINRSAYGDMWIGTQFIRGTPPHEAQAVWFNPDTLATGDVGWGILDEYNTENFTMNHAGTKFLFSGTKDGVGLIAVIRTLEKVIGKYLTPSAMKTYGRLVSVERSKATTNHFVGIVPVAYVNVTVTGGTKPVAGEIMTGLSSGKTAVLWTTPATWTGTITCYFSLTTGFQTESVSFSGGGTGTIPNYLEQKYQAYCIDIGDGHLVWGPTAYAGQATFGVRSDGFGPLWAHGYVWFYSSSNIVKMDPATGTVTNAVTAADFLSQTGDVLYPGILCWIGDTLFHWDNTSCKVYKITGLP